MTAQPVQPLTESERRLIYSEYFVARQYCENHQPKADEIILRHNLERVGRLIATIEAAEVEVVRLREALKPFAKAGAWRFSNSQTDGLVLWTPTCDPGFEITVGDLRRAAALSPQKEPQV